MELTRETLIKELKSSQEFLERSARVLTEADSNVVPVKTPGVMTAAQQLAHIACTVDWFFEGAFRKEGFDMNFEKHAAEVAEVKSIMEARAKVDKSYKGIISALEQKSDAEWSQPIVPGPVMGGEPRWHIVLSVIEHTAHHRGALTVYSRFAGKVPLMPYMEG